MAGTFVARLKRPFLRIRRCRSLKVGSNELHAQDTTSTSVPDGKEKTLPASSTEKKSRAEKGIPDKYRLEHHTPVAAAEVATGGKSSSVEALIDSKRRRSDEWRRRRRRTFDGAKGRKFRNGSLETLFRDSEASEGSSQSAALCAAPILRKLSTFFAAKKQIEGAKGLKASCIQGLDWSANLQNYRPTSYKLFSRRKRSLTLYKCKKDTPAVEDADNPRSGDAGSLGTNPRKGTGRELVSNPMSPPVSLARSEEASPFVLEETSVYDDRIHSSQIAKSSSCRTLSPISREQAPNANRFREDEGEDLGLDLDDPYGMKLAGDPQPQSMLFYIRPRRYTLAPSRFQREHLERMRMAAKVSPTKQNPEDS
ncbi:hypothetical protein R1sor_001220 [Riccia sorocarpa]|uniref:Uncharacterized protein n=1 Tax=Riccia sorocarpa TaxID=122646 RepID=A0ABD3GW80_9MARC